jgi:hypothetical protein
MAMRRIIILGAALLACGVAVAQYVGYEAGYTGTSRGGAYEAGSAAEVDTLRILVRDSALPNTAAVTAGYVKADATYDVITQGSRGQAVRWGHVRKNTPTTVYYDTSAPYQSYYVSFAEARNEDDYTWQADAYLGFIAINTSGMVPGQKVEQFDLIMNVAAFETFIIPAGEYFACRLDTVAADQAMVLSSITGYAADTDTARMDISWDEVDATRNTLWNPDLDLRTDRHDFGPRSNNVIGPGSYTAGTSLKLDMRDAVQQASDRGEVGPGKWLIFVPYGSSGLIDPAFFAAGDYAAWTGSTTGRGCPVAVIRTTSRRGPRTWDGVTPVPMAVILDDQYPVQSSYFTALEAGGKQFDIAVFRNGVNSYTWVDSLYVLKGNLFGLVHHSRTHPSLGGLTADQLKPELSRKWFPEEFTGFVAVDTLGIVDTAWPGGGSVPSKSALAMSEMVEFDYRSSRGYGGGWVATDVGAEYESWLSWSGYTNVYNVRAVNLSNLMNAADMADEIGDYVDLAYTDYAKSALIFYGHRNTTNPADGITPAKLTSAITITDALNSTQILPYEDIIGMRLNGADFVRPQTASAGARNVATVDSVTIRKTAAVLDSLYAADSDPNLLQMWVGPK